MRCLLSCRAYPLTVTDSDTDGVPAIGLPPDVMEAAGYAEAERVEVMCGESGERWSDVVLVSQPGVVVVSGPAARFVVPGDLVSVSAYVYLGEDDVADHAALVLEVDDDNRPLVEPGPA